MQMTVGEIQRSYNSAKNKKTQISILAELNLCSEEEIEKIVGVETRRTDKATPEPIAPAPADLSRGEIIDILFRQMDALEQEIKQLEEEYRNISITIEVLGKIGGR